MTATGFLPPRVAGADARQKAIFDKAAAAAKSREYLVSDHGAAASWQRRHKGLWIALSSRVAHGQGSHVFDVRIRWRNKTVFVAVFHQQLFGRARPRCAVQMYDDLPGGWESLLAGMRSDHER
ncbi:MAG TPA: hypothetical protein VL426_06290 [Candidatus Binatia bacterium]|jgi:hypothetical protein|nr:hypothetical protein [Candidatus Binatia bacterium]